MKVSSARIKKIVKLYKSGLYASTIANRTTNCIYPLSTNEVLSILKDQGVEIKKDGRQKLQDLTLQQEIIDHYKTKTLREIAVIYKIAYSSVRNILIWNNVPRRKVARNNTTTKEEKVLQRYFSGQTVGALANRLYLPYSEVIKILKENNVLLRPRVKRIYPPKK